MALRYIFTVSLLVLGLAALPDTFGARGTTDVVMSNCTGDVEIEHSLTLYAHWVHFRINYISPGKLVIENSQIEWGKWHKGGNMDIEIGSPDNTIIDRSRPADIYSCERSNSAVGIEGYFEVWEDNEDPVQVCRVYWRSLWSLVPRKLIISYLGVKYNVGKTGGNLDRGPLGDVILTIVQIPSVSVV